MKNPLLKRLPRDIKSDWKKYSVLFLLMSFMIGIASSVFVANDSMKFAIDESYEKYNIEDGHFELKEEASENLLNAFEKEGITIVKQYYKDTSEVSEKVNGTVRLFIVREVVNLPCIMDGRLPANKNEIAIDRSHADNNGIIIGDILSINHKDFEVVGLTASSDYTCLFENNADVMFNALTFNIAFLTEEGFDTIQESVKYQYAFEYDNTPSDEIEEKEMSDDLVEKLAVLSATGAYTSNKDEAEELEDNIDAWTNTLEEAKDYADELEARAEALQQRQEALNANRDLILAGDANALQEMNAIQNDYGVLQKDVSDFEKREEELEGIADKLKELEPYEDDMNELIDYVPSYANQSIHFAATDLGKDLAMMNVLVYIFIAVLAFVFAITTANKIKEEAAVIGTLKATGYTKRELISYYMLVPVSITLISALIGNLLGYTVLKEVVIGLYYNSYSLFKYETIWSAKAFVITTLIPLVLMIVINYFVIFRMMKFSPLKFLRRDLSTSKKKKAMRLPAISFMGRFRLRIFLQNTLDYLTLFLGMTFIAILLGFAFGLPASIDHYKVIATDNLIADYQYILKEYKDADDNIIKTNNPDAEPFSTTSLFTVDGVRVNETISVFGFEENSNYIKIEDTLKENEVYISNIFQEKFGYKEGDEIILKEKYENTQYTFKVKGIYYNPSSLAIFMNNDQYNKTFKNDNDAFSGYLSKTEINDIEEDDIYTVVTVEDAMVLANQLDHSMGSFAEYIAMVCLLMGILVMYLLTKLIIEKNANSISMTKVLGYENKEINSLYVRLTTIVVVVLSVISTIAALYLLRYLFGLVMRSMEGWFSLHMGNVDILKMIIVMLVSYLVVAFLDMWQIRKVPLTEALKDEE